MDTSLITIIQQNNVGGESAQQLDLMLRERRTRVGHHVLQSALVHRYHIGIALNHIHAVFFGNRFLTLIKTIELTLLVIDFRVGRIDVFLLHTFGTRIKQSATKGHHLSTHIEPREDDTPRIAVVHAFFAFDAESCLQQELLLIASLLSGHSQGVTLAERETEIKLLYDIIAHTTTAKILATDGHTIGIVMKDIPEVVHGPLVDDKHRLAVTLLTLLLLSQFFFMYLDIIFLSQPAQCLWIGNLLVLHQEVDGCATLTTREALTYLLGWRHHERRGLIIVEWAQSFVVDARFSERHKLTHHIHNVRGIQNLVYRLSVYHQAPTCRKREQGNP